MHGYETETDNFDHIRGERGMFAARELRRLEARIREQREAFERWERRYWRRVHIGFAIFVPIYAALLWCLTF